MWKYWSSFFSDIQPRRIYFIKKFIEKNHALEPHQNLYTSFRVVTKCVYEISEFWLLWVHTSYRSRCTLRGDSLKFWSPPLMTRPSGSFLIWAGVFDKLRKKFIADPFCAMRIQDVSQLLINLLFSPDLGLVYSRRMSKKLFIEYISSYSNFKWANGSRNCTYFEGHNKNLCQYRMSMNFRIKISINWGIKIRGSWNIKKNIN